MTFIVQKTQETGTVERGTVCSFGGANNITTIELNYLAREFNDFKSPQKERIHRNINTVDREQEINNRNKTDIAINRIIKQIQQ